MSDKREKFIKLAENRTRKTIKDIQLIGNLSNTASYLYNEDDVDQIFQVIESEIRASKQRFEVKSDNNSNTFSLR